MSEPEDAFDLVSEIHSDIDRLFQGATARGDDSTPLMALVPDGQYSRGKLTSSARTNSEQYLKFLGKTENRHDR